MKRLGILLVILLVLPCALALGEGEVILTGVFKRPNLTSLAPWAVMQLKDDKSNQTKCTSFISAAENKPGA